MVLASIFSSSASTSSFTSRVARMYLTRNPFSAATVPRPMSMWDFPVPESPIRHRGWPLRIQSPVASVLIVVWLIFRVRFVIEVPKPLVAGEVR